MSVGGPEKNMASAGLAMGKVVPVERIELPTFALRMRCSTS